MTGGDPHSRTRKAPLGQMAGWPSNAISTLPIRNGSCHRAALLPGMRVGLLGGSFNPAHDGHRHISLIALRRLGLHVVIWLVSPQNPLKSTTDMAPFEARLAQAHAVARHPAICVSDLEPRLGTRYTADTLRALRQRFPYTDFVWLMGADNFVQLPRWNRWRQIMATMSVAIIDRPGKGLCAQLGKAAQTFRTSRVPSWRARGLPSLPPPAWVFLQERLHHQSATAIRRTMPNGTLWSDGPNQPMA